MAKEITMARESNATTLRDVRNAEGRVIGREVNLSTTKLDNPALAIAPITSFMTKIGRQAELDMPLRRSSYRMNKNGDILTVGVSVNGETSHVRVRDANGNRLFDRKDIKSDKDLNSYVHFVLRKRGF